MVIFDCERISDVSSETIYVVYRVGQGVRKAYRRGAGRSGGTEFPGAAAWYEESTGLNRSRYRISY